MANDYDKQAQREALKKAVKEYLEKGGVIKRIDLTETGRNFNRINSFDDFSHFSELEVSDSSDSFPIRKSTAGED